MKKAPRKLTIGIELIDDPSWMGGTLYLRNLAICLSQLPESERPKVVIIGVPKVITAFLSEWGHLPIFDSAANNLWGRILWRMGFSVKTARPIDVVYPGFGAEIRGAVKLHWIPDFQHCYLPHLFLAEEIIARDRSISEIAGKPGVVVLSSEVAATDFRRFYPGHLAMPRVWRFYSLIDTTEPASTCPIQNFGLPKKYLYLPNQFWTHKNHLTVLKALARLRREQNLTIPLVCTGAQSDRRNEAHFTGLMKFIQDNQMTDQVHVLGLIDRNDQVDVLRCAAAVVQPSLFEGWSTVVEDVRATGRPIFLSDIPVHKEQNPNYCSYFSPTSDEQLAAILANRWSCLPPGPNPIAERDARRDLGTRILDSARVFCDIACTAINSSII